MALADRIFGRPASGSPTGAPRPMDTLLVRRQRAIKRIFDVTVASAALLGLSPLLLLAAVLVRISSPGPILYRHRRVGQHGTIFEVLKYRTMYSSDEPEWQITVDGDPRITPIGRRLRRSKLDELPQLWNVIRGDMSLVGWRPHVAGYPDRLTGSDAALIGERPGITGAATLYYRNEERELSLQEDPKRYYDEVDLPHQGEVGPRVLPGMVAETGPGVPHRHRSAGRRSLAQRRADNTRQRGRGKRAGVVGGRASRLALDR